MSSALERDGVLICERILSPEAIDQIRLTPMKDLHAKTIRAGVTSNVRWRLIPGLF
jgi:hypothetical protein